jgi:hypothetical protein
VTGQKAEVVAAADMMTALMDEVRKVAEEKGAPVGVS